MHIVVGLTLYICLIVQVNGMISRMYIKTDNISKITWKESMVLQQQTPSYMTCYMLCNQAGDSCNSAAFDADTKMCTHGKVEYLEDATDDDSVSIFLDKEAVNSIDQYCKGGYSCCSKAQRGLPCQLGEGDCRIDSDCKPGLICTPGSCSHKFEYSGGLWDLEDSCCENKCSPERMCTSGEGLCDSAADCLTAPGDVDSVCVQCTDTSMFPPTQHPLMLSYNYSVEDKCCLSRGIQHTKIFDCGVEWLDETYGFRGNLFWKITEDNGFTPEYPKLISTTWIGLPSSGIDASYTKNGVTYFFKGSQLYAYSQTYTMMAGYPINISDRFYGLVDNIDAVAYYYTDVLYIFQGNIYWRYDNENKYPYFSYSKDVPANWSGLPYVDAVIRVGKFLHLFVDGLVYKYDMVASYLVNSDDVSKSWLKEV